jgi:Tfp pilus assembly protein PilE
LLAVRRILRDEKGFTVSELMMTVFIMGLIMVIVHTSLNAFVKTTDATQSKAFSLSDTRLALERVSKQVRAANPIDPLSPVSRYDSEISFSVYCSTPGIGGCGANRLRPVSYKVADNKLTQNVGGSTADVVGPVGPASVPLGQRRGAIVNPVTVPVFRYFDRNGQPYATTGVGAPPATTFRDCVKSVEIRLMVVSEHRKPDNTIDLVTRVDLRNHNEVAEC